MANIRHDRLLWLDIETSDSDEELPHARILEVGISITDFSGRLISERNFVNGLGDRATRLYEWPREVMKMHVKNGLLFEVLDQPPRFSNFALSNAIVAWIDSRETLDGPTLDNEVITLAGSGVSHFDRRWIKKFMPIVDELFTHYSIDVGVVRRQLEMHAPQVLARVAHRTSRNFPSELPHRALDCNRRSITQYLAHMDLFRLLEVDEENRRQQKEAVSTVTHEQLVDTQPRCGAVGPGDSCWYQQHEGGPHSWE